MNERLACKAWPVEYLNGNWFRSHYRRSRTLSIITNTHEPPDTHVFVFTRILCVYVCYIVDPERSSPAHEGVVGSCIGR